MQKTIIICKYYLSINEVDLYQGAIYNRLTNKNTKWTKRNTRSFHKRHFLKGHY